VGAQFGEAAFGDGEAAFANALIQKHKKRERARI
jgi:hypothetical protein